MPDIIRNGVTIDDNFAEAFPMSGTGILITAPNAKWARQAALTMTGFATSVIGCGCEAGIDREAPPEETPDGRPGVRVLLFAMSSKDAEKQLVNRLGQCVLTCPGSAVYSTVAGEFEIKVGDALRQFGDKWQMSKVVDDRRYWRVPVMDGEFFCEGKVGLTKKSVGGGNLLIMGADWDKTMRATEAAVSAIECVADAIAPFPGGIVRSGSKVGSKYKGMSASTNDAYCPTLRGVTKSELDADIGCVLEIVIDGLTDNAVREAMRAGLHAIIEMGPEQGATRVGAGNYGGKLGPFHYHLKELLP
ncbi:formylmethanofuran--tetrahydromethanopterin N-formyltransferase [Methylocystis sp. H62]|jgi:formylmethanofuran--tetrahydromethanopterin N-formyltransferase|uniref:formylmethanofuran--tetrahydromethanopterin N-formyltransferase n=1 Tax=Methylocystis sp. H62 TaxID=2785789 RepID=UPI0018C25104|nr:formylmethanofuran--tetrahydromethanopterin N-formyltransferase [Methylocystis sp. H62]MBG0795458.1 formylmethanofuran--tetrahydromethanopterin N-formyltransferase [Methylocystis sp. H62]